MQRCVRQTNKPFDMAGDVETGPDCAIRGRTATHGVTRPSANAAAIMNFRPVPYPPHHAAGEAPSASGAATATLPIRSRSHLMTCPKAGVISLTYFIPS
jgi:hypothetical protein